MTVKQRRNRGDAKLTITLVFSCAIAALALFSLWTAPVFGDGTFRIGGGELRSFSLPLKFDSGDAPADAEAELAVFLSTLHPTKFLVFADDCVDGMQVDGRRVEGPFPLCGASEARTLDFSGILHPGTNVLRLQLRNYGGPALLHIQPSGKDPLVLSQILLAAGIVTTLAAQWLRRRRAGNGAYELWAVFLWGALLRVFYALSTPPWIRGHDTDGHLQYIREMSHHWILPAARDGWEFYQPPLYYAVGGMIVRAASALGFSEGQALQAVQLSSIALSIATLGLGIVIAVQIFPGAGKRSERLLVAAGVAALPGAVFFAARINNDVLAQFLAFAFFALLLRFWKTRSMRIWYLALALACLAILAKSTGLLLLPVVFGCLILQRRRRPSRRIFHVALGCVMVVALTGWWGAFRFRDAGGASSRVLVGNLDNLNSGLKLDRNIVALTAFHPLQVLRHPYNNAWSDAERRGNFWEYLYRSAFFGEFDFGSDRRILAIVMLLLPMLLAPAAILGCASFLRRWRRTLPLLLVTAALLGGHLLFRILSPYSSSQDFRYSLLTLVPLLAFAIEGLRRLPKVLRELSTAVLQSSIILWIAFLLSL